MTPLGWFIVTEGLALLVLAVLLAVYRQLEAPASDTESAPAG